MESLPLIGGGISRSANRAGAAPTGTPALRRSPGRLALVAGAFPLVSETFVARDVLGLRARGWKIHTVGLHGSDADVPDDRGRPLSADFVVYESKLRLLGTALRETMSSPVRAIRTVTKALWDALHPGETTALLQRFRIPLQALAGIALARWLRRQGIQHVHCHFAHAPATVGMYAALHLGAPFSFTGHANDLFQRRALLRRKLERARFVACISEWHRRLYQGIVAGGPDRYPVIRCGVEIGTDRERRPRIADGPFVILTVGRLIPKKGIDLLLRALALHLNRSGVGWQVWIVGDGPELERLIRLAKGLGCADYVRWFGMISNRRVRHLMWNADAFVLPCRIDEHGDRDGIPVVLMEAMATGLPVVAGDLPTIRELVEDGVGGRIVPPERPDLLVDAIESLERDRTTGKRMAAAARARVESEFSLEVNSARLHGALTQVTTA